MNGIRMWNHDKVKLPGLRKIRDGSLINKLILLHTIQNIRIQTAVKTQDDIKGYRK